MSFVKMNAMTLLTSTAMVLVLMDGQKTYGNVMINAYLEMILAKMNVFTLVKSTAMVHVLRNGKKMCGNAKVNAYL
jgi:hypothetical protein